MTDLISLFKGDLSKLISTLQVDKQIENYDEKSLSIDYSSKSKKGDLSTNILLILFKNKINKEFNLKDYIYNYLINLSYVENIEIYGQIYYKY